MKIYERQFFVFQQYFVFLDQNQSKIWDNVKIYQIFGFLVKISKMFFVLGQSLSKFWFEDEHYQIQSKFWVSCQISPNLVFWGQNYIVGPKLVKFRVYKDKIYQNLGLGQNQSKFWFFKTKFLKICFFFRSNQNSPSGKFCERADN